MVGYVLNDSTINISHLCACRNTTSGLRHIYEVQRMQALSVATCYELLFCFDVYVHIFTILNINWRFVCQAITFLFSQIDCAHESTHFICRVILFKQRGLFWGTPTQIEFLFSFRVNTTWRLINDLLTRQDLWDVSTQGRCSCWTTGEKGYVR